MPTYSLTSPKTGRTYRVNFSQEPEESDMEEAVDAFDAEEPVEPKEKSFFGLGDTASALAEIPSELYQGIPVALRRMKLGLEDPRNYSPEDIAAFEAENQRQIALQQEQEAREARGENTSVGDAFRGAVRSLPFTVGSMGATMAGGAATGAAAGAVAGAVFPPAEIATVPIGTIAGTLGGMLASGTAAYRMAGQQFLDDSIRDLQKKAKSEGKTLTKEELDNAYDVLLPIAQNTGLWEAGPEAVGNAVTAGAGKFIFGFGKDLAADVVKRTLGKKIAAAVGSTAVEVGGETITAMNQGPDQAKAQQFIETGSTEGAPDEYQGVAGALKAAKEVGPTVLATQTLMGGFGGGVKLGQMGLKRLIGKQDTQDPFNPEAQITEDDTSAEDLTLDEATALEPPAPGEIEKRQEERKEAEAEIKASTNIDSAIVAVANVGATETQRVLGEVKGELENQVAIKNQDKDAIAAAEAIQAAQKQAAETKPPTPIEAVQNRDTELFPDATDFAGKLDKEAGLSTYENKDGFGVAEYVNQDTGTTDVYVAAFGDNDYIAYIRAYDENGNPTNRFTSKLERRSNAPGVTKKMLSELQARLPENHEYTEDISVSTDGLKFISGQLRQGYEVATDQNGKPLTQDVAVSGESLVNDLPIAVDPNGKFENIRITNRKEFDKVRPVLGRMLEAFGVGLGEKNVRWENGTAFIDIPVLRKKSVTQTQTQTQETKTNEESILLQQQADDETQTRDGQAPDGQGQEEVITESQVAEELDPFESPLPEALPANVPPATSPVDTTGTQDPFENAPTQGEEVSPQREATVTAPGGTVAPESQQEVAVSEEQTRLESLRDTAKQDISIYEKLIATLEEKQSGGKRLDDRERDAITTARQTIEIHKQSLGEYEDRIAKLQAGGQGTPTIQNRVPSGIQAADAEATTPTDTGGQVSQEVAGEQRLVAGFTGIESPAVAADIKAITDFEASEPSQGRLLTISGTTLTLSEADKLSNERLEDYIRGGVESIVAYERQPSVTPLEKAQEAGTRLSITSAMMTAQGRGMDVKGIMEDERRKRQETTPAIQDSVPSVIQAADTEQASQISFNEADVINLKQIAGFTNNELRKRLSALRLFMQGKIESGAFISPESMENVARLYTEARKRGLLESEPSIDDYIERRDKTKPSQQPPTQESWEQSPEFQAAEEAAARGDMDEAERIEAAWNERNVTPAAETPVPKPKKQPTKKQPPPTIPAKEQVDEGRGTVSPKSSPRTQKRGLPTSAPVDVAGSPKPDTKSSEQKTIKQGDTIRFKQDNKILSGKYLGPITVGGATTYQIQVAGESKPRRVSAKSINDSNDAKLEGTMFSRISDTQQQSPESKRHAELEAKHNAGTITAAETQEAERLVADAARKGGYDVEGWHNTMAFEPFTVFEPRQPVRIDGSKASKYGLSYFSAERAYVRAKSATGTIKALLKIANPWDFRNPDHVSALAKYLANIGIRGQNLDTITRSLEQGQWSIIEKNAVDYIRENGFDGIVMQESPSTPITYAVFDPNQIKSADPFTGVPLDQRFNPESPDIRYSRQRTTRTKTQGLERSVAEKHLKKLGVPSSKVYLVDEPSFKWRGRYDPDGSIGINIAYLNSIDELNDTLFNHESIHDSVETDKKVKQRAIELLDAMTDDELSIMRESLSGYSEAEMQDELIVETIRSLTSRRPDLRTKWARFVEAVTLAIKKFLGIKNLDRQVAELTAARILARGRDRVMRGKMGGRDKFSGNMYAGDAVTAAKDAEYLAAVEAGDMSKAQRMVDEAARRAGYDRTAYRGHEAGSVYSDLSPFDSSIWLTSNKNVADFYATEVMGYENPEVSRFYVSNQGVQSYDIRKLDEATFESLNPDGQNNPQAIGIYANSDDASIGESHTAFHIPRENAKSADPVTYDSSGNVIPLSQRFQPESPDIRYMYSYAGEKAETPQFMRDSLDAAKAMAAAGKSSEEIRAATGWFPGKYDGKMRWEIPDDGATVGEMSNGKLSDVLNHQKLFEMYPSLNGVNIRFFPMVDARGKWSADTNTILVRSEMSDSDSLSTLLHEVQHAIQDIEGFAQGSSPGAFTGDMSGGRKAISDSLIDFNEALEPSGVDPISMEDMVMEDDAFDTLARRFDEASMYLSEDENDNLVSAFNKLAKAMRNGLITPQEAYRRTAGEIEARDVQARQNYTPEQRKAIAPYSSENIAKEDAIVMFGGSGPQASMNLPTQGEPTATQSQLRGIAERTKIEQDIAEASGGKKPKRKRVFGVDDAGRIYTPEDMETAKQAAKGVFNGETMTLDAAGKAQWERVMEQYSVSTPGSGGRVLSLIESGNEMAPTALQTELGIFAERYTDLTKDPAIFKQFVNEVNDLLSVIGGITSAARAMAARRWSPLTERWGAYLKVNKEIKKNGPPDVDEISDDSADEANEEMTDALDDNPDETAAIEAMDQAEATAERIMARVAEQYADAPTAEKAKKGQDPLRALYRELLDGKLTQEQFTTRATQILAGVDEAKLKELYEAETLNEKDATKKLEADWASGVAERLWNAGSMERDAAAQLKAAKDAESAAKKQERREAAEQAKIDAANNRASQLLFEVEKRMRQSGITPMTEAQKDTFRKAFQDQVRKPVSFDAFFRRIEVLNINEDVANRAFRTAARERLDVERMAVFKKKQALLEQDSKALAKLLNQVKGDVKWSDFFTNNSRISQKERQRRIYVQILKNDYLRNLSQAERLQLTRELDKAWARARKKVFISEFSKKIPLKNPKLKKQLAAQAPALLKAINLGTFDSQAYRKEIAKTYGLKDLSDADLVKVIKLGAEIQEARGESLAQRKKIEELANLVSGVTNIPKSHILASYYISSILASGRTGVGAMFSILEVAIEAVVGVTMTTWKSPTQAMAGLNAAFKAFPRGVLEGLSHFRTGDKTGTLLATDSFNQWLKGDGYSPISIGELLWKEKNPVKKFAGLVIMASERMLTGIDLTLSSTLHEAALVWANSITEFKDSKGNTVSLRNPTAADKVRMRQQVIAEWFGGVEPPRSLENIAKINAGMRDQIERFYIDEDPSAGLELVKGARRTASGPSFQGEVTGGVGFLIKRLNGVFADTGEAFEKYAEKNNIGPVERYIAGLGVGAFALAKSFVGLQFVSFIGKLINRNLQFVPLTALVPRWIYGDNVSQYEKGSIRVKNAMGLALISLALAYIMGDDEDEEATLGLEGDWASLSGEQRDAKRTAKAIPSSIWFRDENGQKVYISFANSSLSWIFTSVANLREIKVNNPEKWKETSDAAIAAEGIVGAINSVFNTSATGRLAELLGGSPFSKSTPGAGAEKVARIGTTFAGGFIPSVIREMDFMLDPSYYEPKTLAERAVSVIPFLRRQVADSQGSLGVLGTPAQINRSPTSRVYSSGADTEAEKILARMADEGLYLPLPDDKAGKDYVSPVSGRKIPMTPAQVREYVKLTGESYQSFILREGERLITMPRDRAKDRISDAASDIKKRAARMAMRIQE